MSESPRPRMPMPMTRCRHLFCKGMGIYGDDYRTPVDDLDRTNDFWCRQTLNVLGPDNGLVMLSRCGEERSCHEPL